MILRSWDKLPEYMRNDKVKPYYELLKKRTCSLIMKRIFDIVMSLLLLMILSPVFLVVSIWIKLDSKGPVFFRQVRVTTYGKQFRIFKFRTMCENAEKKGSLVTVGNDSRITKVGEKIRHCRLDEIPQLLNVLAGNHGLPRRQGSVRRPLLHDECASYFYIKPDYNAAIPCSYGL